MYKTEKNESMSVVGIIFNENKSEVLLIKRRDVNMWVLPGGGVEQGESPEEAMIREFQEETGLEVFLKRQIGLYTPINNLANLSYLYECTIVRGNLKTGNETKHLGFFPLSSLPSPFFFIHKRWIEDGKKESPIVICRPLSEVTYFNLLTYFIRHPISVIRMLLSRCGIPLNF